MKFKAGVIALAFAGSAFAQTQGVSKNEIVIGTIQDLSGPVVELFQAGGQRHEHARRGDQRRRAGSTAASSSWWSRTPATTRKRRCSRSRS